MTHPTPEPDDAAPVAINVPPAFYQWLAGIESDVLAHDLTPTEIARLVAALSATTKGPTDAN